MKKPLLALIFAALLATPTFADNPLIMDQFTADPTARNFEGKIYVYPSHDMNNAHEARNGAGWFAMEDYHAFSSDNLLDWKDHGVIVDQKNVPWVITANNAMWAPDCVFRNGKYYFYFPAPAKPIGTGFPGSGRGGAGGNGIGVAIADHPGGPFTPPALPIRGVGGIDPCVLIDKDGQAYLYTAQGRISVSKLKENMTEIDGTPQVVANLPTEGLIEGPFAFERNGIYYLTYPHAVKTAGFESEQLEYATGPTPMGPFTIKGIMMDQTANHCWTNHQSLVEYKGQWMLFYHDKDLSPTFDKDRSIRADYLTFNADGTINKVIPTLRGVGIADAKRKIQIDRYSAISDKDAAVVDFINPEKTFDGWKVTLKDKNAWVQYDRVDFGTGLKSVNIRATAATAGPVEIRLDKPDGPVIARVDIAKGDDWKTATGKLTSAPTGQHNLIVSTPDKSEIAIDWVSFE